MAHSAASVWATRAGSVQDVARTGSPRKLFNGTGSQVAKVLGVANGGRTGLNGAA